MPLDRYVAGIVHGCIPVMLNSSDGTNAFPNALPFEEALDWKRFSTLTDVYDLENLGTQLECLSPQVSLTDAHHALMKLYTVCARENYISDIYCSQIGKMRSGLKEVWPRFLWTTLLHHVSHAIAESCLKGLMLDA